jgi:hypothetical protein
LEQRRVARLRDAGFTARLRIFCDYDPQRVERSGCDYGGIGTISRDLFSDIGLGSVPATPVPHDQPDLEMVGIL